MSQKTRAAGLLETIMTSGSLPGGVTFYTLLCAIIGALPDEDPNDPCGIWKELRLNSEDARKLRIMKAMESFKTSSQQTNPEFVFDGEHWMVKTHFGTQRINDMYSPEAKPEQHFHVRRADGTIFPYVPGHVIPHDAVVVDGPEPKPEEPLWEGELVICTETGEPYNIPRDMPLSRSRRIKVREVRS